MRISHLEAWTRARLGASTLKELEARQLAALALQLARPRSPFYRERLAGLGPGTPLEELPFTSAQELAAAPERFLAVSQDEVARVMTARSSGTTGPGKRFFFSEADLERTVDFFQAGMTDIFADAPGRILVWMPGERPGSVGDLIKKALARLGASSETFGFETPAEKIAAELAKNPAAGLVAVPSLARALFQSGGSQLKEPPGAVLLSADLSPADLKKDLAEAWGAKVFDHYGLTETGYGAAVDCLAFAGAHVRAADLLWELVDPESGRTAPDGQVGELCVTTLGQEALPLFRYRVGDLAVMDQAPCPCGSFLPRIVRHEGRLGQGRAAEKRLGGWR